ncbi:hypothetical protein [Fodinicurvata sediminis]|uniref:hypothetical protein n=1 Tax=Fodinicurvata sediminis TaxID=1121832 RepID=UPI0012DD8146|nr:hypothetical protein [Fodinicurvata sediminis]
MAEETIWRWNVDDVWQTFSSTFQEMTLMHEADNEIIRYHHLSASLLFGGCAIETFLNKQLRACLEEKKSGETQIYKRLRYTSLHEKMEKWPSELYGICLPEHDVETISNALELRNEVVHRKRKDHSLYQELDDTDPVSFVHAVQHIIATTLGASGRAFHYWLLGWNYVGMNGDEAHPFLGSNQQFKYSLNAMGFRVPATDYYAAKAWEAKNMQGLEAFKAMRKQIYDAAPIIEPRHPVFRSPRLCKRWWDKTVVYS